MTNFIFLGFKIIVDHICSHEIKRCLLLGRKAITNRDSVLKSKNIPLQKEVCIVKAMFCSVAMYRCVIWTIKKAENWRIDAFKLWCWRRLLRFPLTESIANKSILQGIILEYSLEGVMLNLKLQWFGYQEWTANSLEKEEEMD